MGRSVMCPAITSPWATKKQDKKGRPHRGRPFIWNRLCNILSFRAKRPPGGWPFCVGIRCSFGGRIAAKMQILQQALCVFKNVSYFAWPVPLCKGNASAFSKVLWSSGCRKRLFDSLSKFENIKKCFQICTDWKEREPWRFPFKLSFPPKPLARRVTRRSSAVPRLSRGTAFFSDISK